LELDVDEGHGNLKISGGSRHWHPNFTWYTLNYSYAFLRGFTNLERMPSFMILFEMFWPMGMPMEIVYETNYHHYFGSKEEVTRKAQLKNSSPIFFYQFFFNP
jgi:hypothetical protein